MTHLRQIMIEELRRRNFAESTIRSYVHGVEHFSQYFGRRPDQLGPRHIREYQAMLFSKLKYSPNTVISRLAALRFFYISEAPVDSTSTPNSLRVGAPDTAQRLLVRFLDFDKCEGVCARCNG